MVSAIFLLNPSKSLWKFTHQFHIDLFSNPQWQKYYERQKYYACSFIKEKWYVNKYVAKICVKLFIWQFFFFLVWLISWMRILFYLKNRDLSKSNLQTHVSWSVSWHKQRKFLRSTEMLLMLIRLEKVTKQSLKNLDSIKPQSERFKVIFTLSMSGQPTNRTPRARGITVCEVSTENSATLKLSHMG